MSDQVLNTEAEIDKRVSDSIKVRNYPMLEILLGREGYVPKEQHLMAAIDAVDNLPDPWSVAGVKLIAETIAVRSQNAAVELAHGLKVAQQKWQRFSNRDNSIPARRAIFVVTKIKNAQTLIPGAANTDTANATAQLPLVSGTHRPWAARPATPWESDQSQSARIEVRHAPSP